MKIRNKEYRKTVSSLISAISEVYLLEDTNLNIISRSEFGSTISAFYNWAIGESIVKSQLIIKLINLFKTTSNKIIKENAIKCLVSFILEWHHDCAHIPPEIVEFIIDNGATLNKTS